MSLWKKEVEEKCLCSLCGRVLEKYDDYDDEKCMDCLLNQQWEMESVERKKKRVRQQRLDSFIEQIPKLIDLLESGNRI